MTQTTKTFLELVNDAIDESGEELTSFKIDGSDFLTNSEAMMNRFKKWVRRAWLDIQEDANDWHWLNEIGIVNISPGIMFYSDQAVSIGTANINPAVIVDVDGTVQVSNLAVSNVQQVSVEDETKIMPARYLGYMDLTYSDYSYTNQHVLDFGLKAGGERLTRENDDRVRFILTANSAAAYTAATFMAVGDVVTSLTLDDDHNVTICTFTEGRLDKKTIDGEFISLEISYKSVNHNPFTTMIASAEAAIADFSIAMDLLVATAAGNKTLSGTMRFDDIGNQFLLTAAISPINYKVNFTAPIGAGTDIRIGDNLVYTYNSTTHLGDIRVVLGSVDIIIDDMFPTGTALGGLLTLSVNGDTGISIETTLGTDPTYHSCWTLWASLLFAAAPVCQANLPGIIFYRADSFVNDEFVFGQGVVVGLYNTLTSTDLASWTFEYEQPYTIKNYVHSWKSYDWTEEVEQNDFVKTIRQVDQNSYRLIGHEEPSPPGEIALNFVPWGVFQSKYDYARAIPSKPRIITEDNMGRWRFYPPVDKPYTIEFNYIRNSQKLEFALDVPKGMPDEYVDMIMWKALTYYGEYDEQPAVAARANKNYKNILLTIQQELRNTFYFRPAMLF